MLSSAAVAKPPHSENPHKQPPGPRPPGVAAPKAQAPSQFVGPPVPGTEKAVHPAHPAAQSPTPTVQLKPGEMPKIEFDTQTYDFGRVKTGKDIEHDFWFHNAGNGPLEILQVKPS
jgi:hypothetical protein